MWSQLMLLPATQLVKLPVVALEQKANCSRANQLIARSPDQVMAKEGEDQLIDLIH